MASALRRKRDEIAAMIVAHEARIDAARKDLAALDQAAQLFDLEAGRDETVISWDLDRLQKSEENLEAPRSQREARGAGGGSIEPSRREDGPRASAHGEDRAYLEPGRGRNGYRWNFFIWIGRNPLKSPDSKK